MKDDKYRSRTVELDDIITYAFAEYHDGTYGFWAAGKAGWFELKDPAPAYKDTFAGMNEAASMFYMLADKLRRAYKTNARLSTKALDRYANAIFRDVCMLGSIARDRVLSERHSIYFTATTQDELTRMMYATGSTITESS